MLETYNNCDPSVVNRKDLMTKDGIFMSAEMVKNQCKCESRIVCFELLRLLKEGNRPEAEDLLSKTKQKGKNKTI